MNIYNFLIGNVEVEFTYRNGFVAYTFKLGEGKEEKIYGSRMKPASRKTMDVIACAILLTESAYETIKKIQ